MSKLNPETFAIGLVCPLCEKPDHRTLAFVQAYTHYKCNRCGEVVPIKDRAEILRAYGGSDEF